MSALYNLSSNDFVKGAVVSALAAAITVLSGVFNQQGFDPFAAHWGVILGDVLKVAGTAFIAYLLKNFATSEDGKFLGKI